MISSKNRVKSIACEGDGHEADRLTEDAFAPEQNMQPRR